MKKEKGYVILPTDITLSYIIRAFCDQIPLDFGFIIDNNETVRHHKCCFIEEIKNPRIVDPSLSQDMMEVTIAFRTRVNEIDSIDPIRWYGVISFSEKIGYPQDMENGWPKFFLGEIKTREEVMYVRV